VKLERVLRSRRRIGRCMPLIIVIPPGLDFSSLKAGAPPKKASWLSLICAIHAQQRLSSLPEPRYQASPTLHSAVISACAA
jgi:hypothetical protein